MTELSFARQFLSTLDSKPNKLSADHVEDPRSYPARSAYILPKQTPPLQKRQKLAPGTESANTITVSLKSLRNPPLDITLQALDPNTSILDLKTTVSTQSSIPLSALRILHSKKPVPDSKVLKDLVKNGAGRLEFSVMVIGGAAAITRREGEEKEVEVAVGSVAQGVSGRELLKGEEFWGDLKGYLVQRLRDEGEGERVFEVFRKAWEGQR